MQTLYEHSRDADARVRAWEITDNQYYVHFHSAVELVWVLEGVLTCHQNGTETDVPAGSLVINSEHMLHGYATRTHSRILVAVIPRHLAVQPGTAAAGQRFRESIIPAERVPEACQLLKMIRDAGPDADTAYLNGLAEALLALLSRRVGLVDAESTRGDLLRDILIFVNENAQTPLTAQSAARHFGYSAGRFSHLFNQGVGLSFPAYLNSVRCRMARHLLEEGRTVREAAEQSGFSSLRTFYRVYRQITGSTPSGGQRNAGGAQ